MIKEDVTQKWFEINLHCRRKTTIMKHKFNKKIAIVKISKNHQQENKKEKRYWEENTIRKPERKIITNNIQRKGVD